MDSLTPLSKDMQESVLNKLNVWDFSTYFEQYSALPIFLDNEFWYRRLRKDFAPLFAQDNIALEEVEESLENSSVKVLKGKTTKINRPFRKHRALPVKETLATALRSDLTYKENYLLLVARTNSAGEQMTEAILQMYGNIRSMLSSDFSEAARNIFFTMLVSGFGYLVKGDVAFEDLAELTLITTEYFWDSTKKWSVLFPNISSSGFSEEDTFPCNSLENVMVGYYRKFANPHEIEVFDSEMD